jgi:hypothetical protein
LFRIACSSAAESPAAFKEIAAAFFAAARARAAASKKLFFLRGKKEVGPGSGLREESRGQREERGEWGRG